MAMVFRAAKAGLIVKTVLLNSALGCIPAVLALFFSNANSASLAETAFDGIVYANCIGTLSWLLVPRMIELFGCRNAVLRIAAAILGLTLSSVAGCFTANLLLMSLGLVHSSDLWSVFRTTLKICFLITMSFGLVTTVIATLQEKLRSTTLALREKELAEERALKIAAEARFASLESRVRPHFLFNTLNSISALVREDPSQAERMIERLSALLRYSLDSELTGLVPLSEELRITQQYLDIEKVRFGGRLRYSVDAGLGTGGSRYRRSPSKHWSRTASSMRSATAVKVPRSMFGPGSRAGNCASKCPTTVLASIPSPVGNPATVSTCSIGVSSRCLVRTPRCECSHRRGAWWSKFLWPPKSHDSRLGGR